MDWRRRNLACLIACVSQAFDGAAAEMEKRSYTLLNPTPRERMREMSTDRPDKTESPYTVDAGHFQLEMDLLTYSRGKADTDEGDAYTEAWAIAPVNLKLGLLNNADLQIVIETYSEVRTEETRNAWARAGSILDFFGSLGTAGDANLTVWERLDGLLDAYESARNGELDSRRSERQSGFGDLTLRLKVNLWGNDGGKTAFAIMPYIKIPTNQDELGNNAVEGGVILPLAVELPRGWSMGLMTEVDILEDEDQDDYHASFINSITFSHDIAGRLGGYVEFFSEVSTEHGVPWVGTLDLGLTYGLTDDIQLDGGINIGLTESADDINPFLGLSWRF